ncbi:MAG: DEAD/DEAH box helicase [Bifidobacteriaceae bacterium]|nr:DEAD/DEAH box helicase [Bifidobacteriaceae bacterium]
MTTFFDLDVPGAPECGAVPEPAAACGPGARDGDETALDSECNTRTDTRTDTNPPPGFAALGLPEVLLQAVSELGFVTPTEIQTAAIPPLMGGHDIVGVAQTGTGKTAAFGLPLLAAIDPAGPGAQALVLAPTRELALQLAAAIESYARGLPAVAVAAVYGGAPYSAQIKALKSGAQIVVATPGRVMDHLARGTFDLTELRFLVIDEADEMLRMGFAEDVDAILAQAPGARQTALFSATMPPAIRATADRHLRDPRRIALTPPSAPATSVVQSYAVVPARFKVEALVRVLAVMPGEAAIVFVRTRGDAETVAQELAARGINAAGISGEVAQRERERIVQRLRSGLLDVLVATDVAARGMDVERIGLVVNFDVPREAVSYVHRIGRTGRAGRAGQAITFVTPSERGKLRGIERHIGSELAEYTVPSVAQVADHQFAALLRRVPERLAAGRLAPAYRAVAEALDDGADPASLAAALAALAVEGRAGSLQDTKDDAEDGLDLALKELRRRPAARGQSARGQSARGQSARGQHRADFPPNGRKGRTGLNAGGAASGKRSLTGAQRYWIGVGHGDGVAPGAIVGAITGETELRGGDLGRIQIFKNFSLVEIGAKLSRDTMRRLAKTRVAGRALRIRPDLG